MPNSSDYPCSWGLSNLPNTNMYPKSSILYICVQFICEISIRRKQILAGCIGLSHRSDRLIEVFKIIHGLSTVKFSTFFEYTTHERTRGHPLKLNKNRVRTDLRQHFFSERVINTWNKLDSDIVCSSSLNIFKNNLERLHKDESFIGLFRSA